MSRNYKSLYAKKQKLPNAFSLIFQDDSYANHSKRCSDNKISSQIGLMSLKQHDRYEHFRNQSQNELATCKVSEFNSQQNTQDTIKKQHNANNLQTTGSQYRDMTQKSCHKQESYNIQNDYLLTAQFLYHSQRYCESSIFLKKVLQKFLKYQNCQSDNNHSRGFKLVQIYYYLALNQKKMNNLPQSLKYLQAILQIIPGFQQAYFQIAKVYLIQRKFEDAEIIYTKLIKINPLCVEAYIQYASLLIGNKKYKQAKQVYTKSIQINKNHAKLLYNLATLCLQNLKQLDEAFRYYSQSVKLQPRNSKTYLKLGIIYCQWNKFEQAKNSFLKAIKFSPKNQDGYFNLGILYVRLGFEEKAQKIYKKIIQQINPKFQDAYYNLSTLYYSQKRFNDSEAYYKKLLSINKNYGNALLNLAILLHYTYKFQQAKKYYLQYFKINQRNEEAYICFADLLVNEYKNFQEAQKYYIKALRVNQNSANAYFHLAVLYYTIKNQDKSREYFKKAISINPNNAKSYYNYGILQSTQKNYDIALINFTKAEQLQPDNPLFLMALAKLYFQLNSSFEQIFMKLNKAKQSIHSFSEQQILEKYDLNKQNIEWIKSTLQQVETIQRIEQNKDHLNQQQLQVLSDINNSFFSSFEDDVIKMRGQNQQINKIKKRLEVLESQLKCLKQDMQSIKKQLQWDNKFDDMLKTHCKQSAYLCSLFTIISSSIHAYRSVHLGIVKPGDNVAKSKTGGFIQKISKILSIGQKAPVISGFCSILVKLGEYYNKTESEHIVQQIVIATQRLYNQKKLTKATSQSIIYLSNSQIFQKIATIQDQCENIWYKKIIDNIEKVRQKSIKLQQDIISRISSVGGLQLSDQMNLAMTHCAQILLTMVRIENNKQIQQANNPLLKAMQIWIQQQIKHRKSFREISNNANKFQIKNSKQNKINLLIYKANLKKNTRVFGKMSPYCLVTYGSNQWQTDVHKNGHLNPVWVCSEFQLNKASQNYSSIELDQKQLITFRVYDKSNLSCQDKFIAQGSIQFDIQKLLHVNCIDLIRKQKKVGDLKLKFY